jgi:alkylhydroperoxidase family enzyme
MRPAVLEDGHRLRARIFIRLVRALSRQRIDPVVQMAMYRPQFFGDPFFILGPEVLRGPSYWTPAERVAAILPLLEKVTRTPDQVASADVDAVRAAGVPDEGIVDALHVNLIFNIMNRLANAFDFSWDSEEHVRVGAKVIHRISYQLPRVLTASRT